MLVFITDCCILCISVIYRERTTYGDDQVHKHLKVGLSSFILYIDCKKSTLKSLTIQGNYTILVPKLMDVLQERKTAELFPTGSNIPDCSHACGPCFPCQRVMIGYKCQMTESCPVIYRCFCRGRFYHVPTS